MSREVKFRARHSSHGAWIFWSPRDEWSEHGTQFWLDADMSTLGQFTGLKDKNGKEIYEGDIVSWDVGTPRTRRHGGTAVVKWDEDEIGFRPYINITTEVIGNIYEDPNLLTDHE